MHAPIAAQECDINNDSMITKDEFFNAISRWVQEKLATAATATAGGSSYRSLVDPRRGGATASLLTDLPEDDLLQLQVG